MSVRTHPLTAAWHFRPPRSRWSDELFPTLRRASSWLVLAVALGIAVGAAWFIGDLQDYADDRRRTQLLLGDIERLAGELRFLELQVRTGWGVEAEGLELTPLLRSLERQLLELERLDGRGDVSFRVREAVEQYTANFDQYLRLVSTEKADPEAIRRWVRERTRPSYELLVEAVTQASIYFSAQSSRALKRVDLGSKATIALEAFLIVVLALLVHRIRRQEERHLVEERERSEARFRSLVQNSSDAIEVVDRSGVVLYASDSVERVVGREPQAAVGRSIFDSIHAADQDAAREHFAQALVRPGRVEQIELRMQRADGRWIWTEVTAANLLDDPNVDGMVLNFRDISDRKRLEEELRHMALHDSLTGLANRTLFLDLLGRTLKEGQRHEFPVTVCYLDLDGFKAVNDTLGHQAGDQVLIWMAENLRAVLRAEDIGARLGGDEFALLLRGTDAEAAEVVARRLLRTVDTPLRVEGQTASVGVSIGIAVSHGEEVDPEELLRRADEAMYAAKSEGKGRFRVSDDGGPSKKLIHRQPLLALTGGKNS